MKNVFLTEYSINGIKNLNKEVTLSFYKKTITKPIDTQSYNMKAVYGMNGSGKSGIIASVDILKNLLINPDYLNNTLVQNSLHELINKKTQELHISVQYLINHKATTYLYHYTIDLTLKNDRYTIFHEELEYRNAFSNSGKWKKVFVTNDGNLTFPDQSDEMEIRDFYSKSINLLSTTSLSALLSINKDTAKETPFFQHLLSLIIFGTNLHVSTESQDDHRSYLIPDNLETLFNYNDVLKMYKKSSRRNINVFQVPETRVIKDSYPDYEQKTHNLLHFLQLFKPELKDIEISRKEDKYSYECTLIMIYDDYRVNVEFESTGIKKLIRLSTYLLEMVNGGIVFIDEFDANLHDVYLCALLEYLMMFGEGQLCFTTHNISSMNVLNQNKKSIDFISMDHEIVAWRKNGNYSPASLYREGMITGSPFNIFPTSFVGNLDPEEND